MAVVLLLARLVLSAVFLIAGFAKLADLPGSQKALHDFGVPEALARPLGLVIPIIEIIIVIALVLAHLAWYGAIGALVLLLVFIVGISYNLARGRRPDCHCFGHLHSAPVGPSTLARNIFLALLAVLVVWPGRGTTSLSVIAWFTAWPLAQQITLIVAVIAVVLIAGEGWLLLQSLSQYGRLLLRTERLERRLAQAGIVFGMPEIEPSAAGLPIGAAAPAFSGRGPANEMISFRALRALGKPIVLIFTSPTCGPCAALMPEVGRWQRDYAKKLTIVLLSRGSVEDNRTKVAEHHLAHLIIQSQDEIDKLYNIHGTPSAVLIHPDGRIDSPLVVGPDDIRALVIEAANVRQWPLLPLIVLGNNQHRATPESPRVGTQAPAFSLPDFQGELVALSSFRGNPTLLLFWNTNCGFCKKMLPDLKIWEADPPHGAPRLLVISEGTVEENRAMGLRSPVLLTRESDVRMRFGATGTPMAILIDAQGRIASTLVVGASDVLSLLSSATIPVGP